MKSAGRVYKRGAEDRRGHLNMIDIIRIGRGEGGRGKRGGGGGGGGGRGGGKGEERINCYHVLTDS